MNLKKLRYVYEFLVEVINHWMLFPMALVAMGTTKFMTGRTEPDVLLWVMCGLIPVGFFLLRILCNKKERLIYTLLLHAITSILAVAVLWFAMDPVPRGISIACVVFYMLYSLLLMLKKGSVYSGIIHLPVGIAISVVAALMRREDHWGDYYIFAMIGATALFSVIFYMQHYMDFLTVNKGSAGFLPASEMFRSGMGLVAGYTALGIVLVVILTRFEWLTVLLQPVKEFLIQVFKKIMEFILWFLRHLFSEDFLQKAESGGQSETLNLPVGEGESLFWSLLENIGMLAIAGLFLFVVIKVFVRLIQFLQGFLKRRSIEQENLDEEVFDFRESCDIEKEKERKKLDLFGFLSYREQVRRLYKKKLVSSSAQIGGEDRERLGVYTAREWGKKLEAAGMAEVYERARYTEQEITAADVKEMKEACKGTVGGIGK